MIQSGASGYGGVTESNVQRKIAAEVGEKAADLRAILPSLESMEQRFGEYFGLEVAQSLRGLQAAELEASFLGEYLKGQVTLYNTQIQGKIQETLQKLIHQGNLEVTELQNLAEMAKVEEAYFSSEFIEDPQTGDKLLVNKKTGEVITRFTGSGPGGGGGVQNVSDAPGKQTIYGENYGLNISPANQQKLDNIYNTSFDFGTTDLWGGGVVGPSGNAGY
jgi:hypothetical protein